jgi:SAM-dependent methyltransferase
MPSRTETRTFDQIKRHYEREKKLANRLRQATQSERQQLYGEVYAELRRDLLGNLSLPNNDRASETERVTAQMSFLSRFLYQEAVFMELGASSCRTSIEVAKRVKKVYAIDVSFGEVNKCSLPKNLECRVFDGLHMPIPSGSIDIAYSHQVMEHVHPEDALEQLRSIYNVLAPGGKYICITPNRLNGPHDISQYFDQFATGFHLKEYTTTELAAVFRSVGFSKVSTYTGGRGYYAAIPEISFELLERALSAFPWRLRLALGRRVPLRPLLAIRMVGCKS